MTSHEQLLSSVLRGESQHWPWEGDDGAATSFCDSAEFHRLLPLIHSALSNGTARWPVSILDKCRLASLTHAMRELAYQAEVGRLIALLEDSGIPTLLLKGTALAYSCYTTPALRPRADTDLLVPPECSQRAARMLHSTGYRRVSGPAGKYVGYQIEMHRMDSLGVRHNIDLHWRISNLQFFAWRFSFDELAADAVPVPRLHPLAMRVGNAHALLLNLLHRAGDRLDARTCCGERLIRLYDIKLLVELMSDKELDDFLRMTATKGLAAIAEDGLRSCASRLDSARLRALIGALADLSGVHARPFHVGRLSREWLEIMAIPGAWPRISYLANRAFPTPEYMRERFPDSTARSLSRLHLRRLREGLSKLCSTPAD